MKRRNIVTTTLMLIAAAYTARKVAKIAAEWARTDKIRAMSNEGPLLEEMPDLAAQMVFAERDFIAELGRFSVKFPIEIAKYLKATAM
jgi:hypothetical protein